MITCDSYLFYNKNGEKLKGKNGFEKMIAKPYDYFVSIRDPNLQNIFDDQFYIEGAILIKYYNKEILSFRHYDLIDQLWTNLLHTLSEYNSKGKSSFYFPDQNLKLELVDDHSKLNINIGEQVFSIKPHDRHEFLICLLKAGEEFFKMLSNISNRNDFSYQMTFVQKLLNELN